jgi:imidazolonepropionase-like amidohydrolase
LQQSHLDDNSKYRRVTLDPLLSTRPVYTHAMHPKLFTCLLLICLLISCGPASAPEVTTAPFSPDSGSIAVRCGLLIDGLGDVVQEDKTIVIADGRIVSVVDSADYRDAVLDLSDRSCLPGLIDTHTHLSDAPSTNDLSIFYTITPAETLAASRANAAITLAAGFTTVRNVGAYIGWSGRDLRDRINRGELVGPRAQTAGFYLTIPAGGGDLVIPGHDESEIPPAIRLGVARGAAEFRQKARAAVDGGADVLKVIASGAVLAFGGVPGAPEMTPDEIRAVVEVGHAAGIKVTAHAHGAQSIKDAINAGVDSIEHASLADDEAISLAAEKQVAFSMDVYNADYIAVEGVAQGWPEEFIRKNNETGEAQRQVFSRAYKAGVPIIYGTDSGVYPHGDNAKQFVIMVERGMPAMDAIKAATSVAARYIGWADDVGALVPGRYGDLIAVGGNPLDDIGILQYVDVVIKGGLLFKQ